MSYFSIDSAEIGTRIKRLRKEAQKPQYQFADLLYISPSYLALIESGKRAPTLDVLVQVSKICNVSIDYLLFGESSDDYNDLHQKLQTLMDSYPDAQVQKALELAEFYLQLESKETAGRTAGPDARAESSFHFIFHQSGNTGGNPPECFRIYLTGSL